MPIDERKVAARCYAESADVVKMLAELDAMHIVRYRPCPQTPQIYFLSERIDEKLIQPSDEHYGFLKEAAHRRMEAMVKYVTCDNVCRSRQLVAWFGEKTDSDCGLCDVCLRATETLPSTNDLVEAVETRLAQNAMNPTDLVEALRNDGYGNVRDTLRDMLDKGILELTAENLLRLAQ